MMCARFLRHEAGQHNRFTASPRMYSTGFSAPTIFLRWFSVISSNLAGHGFGNDLPDIYSLSRLQGLLPQD